jgi:hypothetical protein
MTLRSRKRQSFFIRIGDGHNDIQNEIPIASTSKNVVRSGSSLSKGSLLVLLLGFSGWVIVNRFDANNAFTYLCESNEDRPREELIWDWKFFANETGKSVVSTGAGTLSSHTLFEQEHRHRLLIVQHAAHGRLLQVAAKVNQLYAQKWKHDYVSIQGSTVDWLEILRHDKHNEHVAKASTHEFGASACDLPYHFSQWNKVHLLQMLASPTQNIFFQNQSNYDQVLLLDETAMLSDIERDVTTLLAKTDMMAAQRVHRKRGLRGIILGSTTRTWDCGVMLWNLGHPDTPTVANEWARQGSKKINSGSSATNPPLSDQWVLHDVLQTKDYKSHVKTLLKGFTDSGEIAMVQQFHGFPNDFEGHWGPIDQAVAAVCQGSPSMCTDLRTSKASRRQPEWDWRYYSKESKKNVSDYGFPWSGTNDRRKLLIAQYAAYGEYARILEMTAPPNKAYARMWHHDYVVLQGSAISVFPRDSWSTPPEERSRFNKIPLLQMALARRHEYDLLLLLDADAMIYDFSKDIRSYLPLPSQTQNHETPMLVAHRVNPREGRHSWDINNGVTLWNLHHPMTEVVTDDWYQRTRYELNRNPTTRRYMLTGDQSVLQAVLQEGNRQDYVDTLVKDFRYRNGTVIKHFTRENLNWDKYDIWKTTFLESRSESIQNASQFACRRFFPACDGIEHTVYTQL